VSLNGYVHFIIHGKHFVKFFEAIGPIATGGKLFLGTYAVQLPGIFQKMLYTANCAGVLVPHNTY